MKYRSCTELEATGLVTALFTEGNLDWVGSFDRAAQPRAWENITDLAQDCNVSPDRMIRADQKHTNTIRLVGEAEAGEGITRAYTVGPHDGLITDVPGIMLCTTEADCLPIYLLDPAHRAIGMVHSGWRGTAALIGPAAVQRMGETFGSVPADLLVYFGPSICGNCYEVGPELVEAFSVSFDTEERAQFFAPCENGKLLLDNATAARISLLRCGVETDHLYECGICTYEHAKFASYRRNRDIGPHLLTAIILKE